MKKDLASSYGFKFCEDCPCRFMGCPLDLFSPFSMILSNVYLHKTENGLYFQTEIKCTDSYDLITDRDTQRTIKKTKNFNDEFKEEFREKMSGHRIVKEFKRENKEWLRQLDN